MKFTINYCSIMLIITQLHNHFRPSQRLMMRPSTYALLRLCVDRACVNVQYFIFRRARLQKKEFCETKQEKKITCFLYCVFCMKLFSQKYMWVRQRLLAQKELLALRQTTQDGAIKSSLHRFAMKRKQHLRIDCGYRSNINPGP